MRYWVSGNSVDLGGGVYLLHPIGFAQSAAGDLAGSGFFPGRGRGKGKLAAGAKAQNAADDSLLAHANTHHGALLTGALQKFHHDHVVIKAGSGADDLDVIRRNALHFGKSIIELFGRAKVVERKNERGLLADLLNVGGLELLVALD